MDIEAEVDSRVDPNFSGHVLLEIAQERSLPLLLEKLVARGLERPDVVCVQVWLLEQPEPGKESSARRLQLVAGRGSSVAGPGPEPAYFGDTSQRVEWGRGFIGHIASAGKQVMIRDINLEPDAVADISWVWNEKVKACGGTPIKYKGELLGVIAGFSRNVPWHDAHLWGQIFADHIGAAIANARAFEQIEQLKAQLELQNTYLQEEVVEAKAFGSLIGQSAALRQIVSQVDLVAPTDASVIVLGETGTGKELVAHEIHRRSMRKDKPFVRVNCASIPRELYESEFFGHVKGAFTGAVRDRPGRFEMAEGGSLFLDEVGEIPLELQGKLLRVLQEMRYERVGDDRTRTANVRIIGATNRDLKQEVAVGRFRQDLYYRLHVFPIHVPALKERPEDIPLLAKHFIDLSVRELRCRTPMLTRAALSQLEAYSWPGNIRELRNVIQRAVILARGRPLHFDLPSSARPVAKVPEPSRGSGFLTEAQMQQRERENLLAALDAANWKVMGAGGAAELLGVRPTTLFSRMKKLGLQKP